MPDMRFPIWEQGKMGGNGGNWGGMGGNRGKWQCLLIVVPHRDGVWEGRVCGGWGDGGSRKEGLWTGPLE